MSDDWNVYEHWCFHHNNRFRHIFATFFPPSASTTSAIIPSRNARAFYFIFSANHYEFLVSSSATRIEQVFHSLIQRRYGLPFVIPRGTHNTDLTRQMNFSSQIIISVDASELAEKKNKTTFRPSNPGQTAAGCSWPPDWFRRVWEPGFGEQSLKTKKNKDTYVYTYIDIIFFALTLE